MNNAQKSTDPRLNKKPYTNTGQQPNHSTNHHGGARANTTHTMNQSNGFVADNSEATVQSDYSNPDHREKYDPQKLEHYISSLQNMVAPLAQ